MGPSAELSLWRGAAGRGGGSGVVSVAGVAVAREGLDQATKGPEAMGSHGRLQQGSDAFRLSLRGHSA